MDNHAGTSLDAKQALRRTVRARRAAVTAVERRRRDAAIIARLVDHLRETADGEPVAAFVGLPGEPGGPGLPEALRDAGFPVWLPVVAGPAQPLRWLPYLGPDDLRPGYMGISEPGETPAGPLALSTVELSTQVHSLVIPALAVDRDGTRLGQGGGFYDRSLGTLGTSPGGGAPVTLVAVVDHEECGVDVPRTGLDASVGTVVTDEGIHHGYREHR